MLSIELNHTPTVRLTYTEKFACPACGNHTAVVVGDDWTCVYCMMQKSGKDFVLISGWQLTKSATGQINANRIV